MTYRKPEWNGSWVEVEVNELCESSADNHAKFDDHFEAEGFKSPFNTGEPWKTSAHQSHKSWTIYIYCPLENKCDKNKNK